MNSDQPKQPESAPLIQLQPTPRSEPLRVTLEDALDIYRQALAAGIVIHAEYIAHQIADAWPDELAAQLPLVDAYTNTQRGAVANKFAEQLLERFPDEPRLLKRAASYYQGAGNGARAISLLAHARTISPSDPEISHLLGVVETAMGRKPEAVAAFNEAISLAPKYADAYFSRALVEKSAAPRETILDLERLIEDGVESPLKQGKLHLAAAWCLDGQDTEMQFVHLRRAGELFNRVFEWSEERSRLQLNAITSFINNDLVRALHEFGDSEPKPIYIAAMPRSGTTLLEQVLGNHSQCMSIGESQLFNHAISQVGFDLEQPTAYWDWGQGENFAPILNRLNEFYESHAKVKNAADLRIVDKSLDNYMTAGLILLTHPNARIIHLERHPLDTILSMYQLYIEMGPNIPFRLEDLARHYKITLEYMAHWKRLFPSRIISVSYEKLVAEPDLQVRRILEFCELPWEQACLEFHKAPSSVNTPSTLQVRQKIHSNAVNRWKSYAKQLQAAAAIMGIAIDPPFDDNSNT